jgi:glycerol uptake facilitator-like aquaporin
MQGVIPGCTVDPDSVSPGQLFALEYVFAQALLFTAFGVGLDPRQAGVLGPVLAPILVGIVLGLSNLASGIARPGYTGIGEERLGPYSLS